MVVLELVSDLQNFRPCSFTNAVSVFFHTKIETIEEQLFNSVINQVDSTHLQAYLAAFDKAIVCSNHYSLISIILQVSMGLAKTDIHAISAYRRILQHAREQKDETARSLTPVRNRSLLDAPSNFPESIRAPPTPFSVYLDDSKLHVDNGTALALESPTQVDFSFSRNYADTPTGVFSGGNPPLHSSDDRVDEWIVDSNTLLADAYAVRRLLRFGTRRWRMLVNKQDRITEALLEAETEVGTKLKLSVLVAWLVWCGGVRKEARLAASLREQRVRETTNVCFKQWELKWRKESRRRVLAEARIVDLKEQVIRRWFSVTVPTARAARQLKDQLRTRSVIAGWVRWKSSRARRHLDSIHLLNQMESFRLHQCFCVFSAFVNNRKRARLGVHVYKSKMRRKVVAGWAGRMTQQRSITAKFTGNTIAPYCVLKLANGVNPGVHESQFGKSSESTWKSVQYVAMCKWRAFAAAQRRARQEEGLRVKSGFLRRWRDIVRQSRRMRTAVIKLDRWMADRGAVHVRSHFFSTWKSRFIARRAFRRQLGEYSYRTVQGSLGKAVTVWWEISKREKFLRKKQSLCTKLVKRRFFKHFLQVKNQLVEEILLHQIGEVANIKRLARILVGSFKFAVEYRQGMHELEDRGKWLALMVRFQRWQRVCSQRYQLKATGRRVAQLQRFRTLHGCLTVWTGAARTHYLARTRADQLKNQILSVLRLNCIRAKKERINCVLAVELQKKVFFHRLRRWRRGRVTVETARKRWLESSFFKRWIQYMLVNDVLRSLDRTAERLVLSGAIASLTDHASRKAQTEVTAVEKIITSKISNIVSEWRLLTLFNILTRKRDEGGVVTSSPASPTVGSKATELKRKYFNRLRRHFVILEQLSSLDARRNTRLKIAVLVNRSSGWRVSVVESRLTRRVDGCRIIGVWKVWRAAHARESEKARICRLKQLSLESGKVRQIIRNWFLTVQNQRRAVADIFAHWRLFARSASETRHRLIYSIPRKIARNKQLFFKQWKERFAKRQWLRNRISNFSIDYERRLALRTVLGFVKNGEECRKIRWLEGCVIRRVKSGAITRWVNGAVLAISLKEVFARIECILAKIEMVNLFKKLRNSTRIAKFVQKRESHVEAIEMERRSARQSEVIHGWHTAVATIRVNKTKIAFNQKKIGLRTLAANRVANETNRQLNDIACEFALHHETDRLMHLVELSLVEWRGVVETKRELVCRGEMLSDLVTRRKLVGFFAEWKYSLELAVYQTDLERNEAALIARMQMRTKDNIFTCMSILFQEAQGVVRFADTVHASSLKERAMRSLNYFVAMKRIQHQVERAVRISILDRYFHAMCREVYLRFKEKMHWKRSVCEGVFWQLRSNMAFERTATLRRMFSRWRRRYRMQSEAKRKQLKSLVLSSWRVVVNETKLLRLTLASSVPTMSYHDQRRKKIDITTPPPTPMFTPVPSSVGGPSSAQFSYRDMRPRSEQNV